MKTEEGHFDDISLNGLCRVNLYGWPGQMHEGNEAQQSIIDIRADEQQRQALQTILSGQETEPGATVFQVYATMTDTIHEPLFKPIEFTFDPDDSHCSCRRVVPGIVESVADGVLQVPEDGNTDESKPAGAVQCSASTRANAQIQFDLSDSHGHFAIFHITPSGVMR